MLSPEEIERVGEKWLPQSWPDGAGYAYARAMHVRPYRYFRERVRHLGLSGNLVIDAGCGTGTWAFALACEFERVLAFDFTPERVAVANRLKDQFTVPQPVFVQGDIRSIPVEDAVADAVFCYSVVLGVIPLEDIYSEFYRVLRPGGIAYLELNGIGYGYNLFGMGGGENKKIGGDVVYNTYCKAVFASVIAAIRPGGPQNVVALSTAQSGSPLEILRAIGGDPDMLAAANAIARNLGADYSVLLLNDLVAVACGDRTDFSRPSYGRGYTPKELELASAQAGFRRFEWAHEGMLSLQPDASVRKEKCPTAPPISLPEYNGHLRRFETLTWK